jgi:hypothetical protein
MYNAKASMVTPATGPRRRVASIWEFGHGLMKAALANQQHRRRNRFGYLLVGRPFYPRKSSVMPYSRFGASESNDGRQ